MMLLEVISTFWPILVAFVGYIWWLGNLQGRVKEARQEIATERLLRENLQQRVDGFEQRIYRILERIETKLDGKANRDE